MNTGVTSSALFGAVESEWSADDIEAVRATIEPGWTGERSRVFWDYDGAPLRSASLPHPVESARWDELDLLRVDLDNDRLVLTHKGREMRDFFLQVPNK